MNEEHEHDVLHVQRAFDRARRVLALARRPELPEPSVELFADGSAGFMFPTALAQALEGDTAGEIMKLIGSNRRRGVPGGVVVDVCCTLGRMED